MSEAYNFILDTGPHQPVGGWGPSFEQRWDKEVSERGESWERPGEKTKDCEQNRSLKMFEEAQNLFILHIYEMD